MVLDFSFFQIMKSAGNGYFLKFGMGVCCCWKKVVTLSLHPRPDPVQLQFCHFVLNYAPKILILHNWRFVWPPKWGWELRKGARSARERGNTSFVPSGFSRSPSNLMGSWFFPYPGLNCSKTLSLTAEHKF